MEKNRPMTLPNHKNKLYLNITRPQDPIIITNKELVSHLIELVEDPFTKGRGKSYLIQRCKIFSVMDSDCIRSTIQLLEIMADKTSKEL